MIEPENLPQAVMEAQRAKDQAYTERNRLVAALSKQYPSHLIWHQDAADSPEPWDPEWRTIVCVHGGADTGQMTWHVHDSERSLFAHLENVDIPSCPGWDGHTTEEDKYERLERIPARHRLDASSRAVQTPLSLNLNVVDFDVACDVWDRADIDGGKWLRTDSRGRPVARLRQVGWIDQKGRVYPVAYGRLGSGWDGGSLSPLLIDPGERN